MRFAAMATMLILALPVSGFGQGTSSTTDQVSIDYVRSANPRMLTRANVRFLCLECHANLPTVPSSVAGVVPPSFHDLRSPRFQNCTVCHQKIHGSHVDRNLLR